MARLPRLIIPLQPHHVIQRGNNDQLIFQDSEDYLAFLGWLRSAAKTYKVAVHAYVLLPNHLHLLVSPSDEAVDRSLLRALFQSKIWPQRHLVAGTLQNLADRCG